MNQCQLHDVIMKIYKDPDVVDHHHGVKLRMCSDTSPPPIPVYAYPFSGANTCGIVVEVLVF
jgi:hypothetical protein